MLEPSIRLLTLLQAIIIISRRRRIIPVEQRRKRIRRRYLRMSDAARHCYRRRADRHAL